MSISPTRGSTSIRGRAPSDSTLIARKLEDAEIVVVATPTYLKRAGTPLHPDELAGHECIQFELASNGRNLVWQFQQGDQVVDVITQGGARLSGDVLGG